MVHNERNYIMAHIFLPFQKMLSMYADSFFTPAAEKIKLKDKTGYYFINRNVQNQHIFSEKKESEQ